MTSPAPRLTVNFPPGLASVRLDDADDPIAAQARRLVEQAGHTGEVEPMARRVVGFLDALGAMNVQLIGKFAVGDGAAPALATLLLAIQALPLDSEDTDASGIAGALREVVRRKNPDMDTRVITLPIGPAVAGVSFGEFRFPAADGQDGSILPTFRAQFLIPLPVERHVVLLDVSTTDEHAWPKVAREAVAVAGSVRVSGTSS